MAEGNETEVNSCLREVINNSMPEDQVIHDETATSAQHLANHDSYTIAHLMETNGDYIDCATVEVCLPDENLEVQVVPTNTPNPHMKQASATSVRVTGHGPCKLVFYDLELTGLGPEAEVLQIAAVHGSTAFSVYMLPKHIIPAEASRVNGLTVKEGKLFLRDTQVSTIRRVEAWKCFVQFIEDIGQPIILAAHNARFDLRYTIRDLKTYRMFDVFEEIVYGYLDTLPLMRQVLPTRKSHKLVDLVDDILGCDFNFEAHNAVDDSCALQQLVSCLKISEQALRRNIFPLENCIKKRKPYCGKRDTKKETKMNTSAGSAQSQRTAQLIPGTSTDHITCTTVARKYPDANLEAQDIPANVLKPHMKQTTATSLQVNGIGVSKLVYYDLETSGLGGEAEVLQIAAVHEDKTFSAYMLPKNNIPLEASKVNGLTVKEGRLFFHDTEVSTVPPEEAWTDFLKFIQDIGQPIILVAHSARFDLRYTVRDLRAVKMLKRFRKLVYGYLDTYPLMRKVLPCRQSYKLVDLVADILGADFTFEAHNALGDSHALQQLVSRSNIRDQVLRRSLTSLEDFITNMKPFYVKHGQRTQTETTASAGSAKSPETALLLPGTSTDHINCATIERKCPDASVEMQDIPANAALLLPGTSTERKHPDASVETQDIPANAALLLPGTSTDHINCATIERKHPDTSVDMQDIAANVLKPHMKQTTATSLKVNGIGANKLVYYDLETSGLGADAEVLQIAAVHENTTFSVYMLPKHSISVHASRVNGLTVKEGRLFLHDTEVPTVPLAEAWKGFVKFIQDIGQPIILVAHNAPFDLRYTVRDLKAVKMLKQFEEIVQGYLDTCPLMRQVLPFRQSYKLVDLVADILGVEFKFEAHSGVGDSYALQQLVSRLNINEQLLQRSISSLQDFVRNKRQNPDFGKPQNAKDKTASQVIGINIHLDEECTTVLDGPSSTEAQQCDAAVSEQNTLQEATQSSASAETCLEAPEATQSSPASAQTCLETEQTTQCSSISAQARLNSLVDAIKDLHVDSKYHQSTTKGNSIVYFAIETTGSSEDSEVCQIAAVHRRDTFCAYIMPQNNIPGKISSINGLSTREGKLFFHDLEVDSKDPSVALSDFIDFLMGRQGKVILAGHNVNFSARFILRAICRSNLTDSFKTAVSGFVDTLPILKSNLPSKMSYKLNDLIVDVLGDNFTCPDHGALYRVCGLRQLMTYCDPNRNEHAQIALTENLMQKVQTSKK